MGLFSRNKDNSSTGEQPLYQSSRMGFYARVYSNRLEFKNGAKHESIPLNQIAGVELGIIGKDTVIVETTGGAKYTIVSPKKKELREAIYNAISTKTNQPIASNSVADELGKLAELKEKGVITQEEFDSKKRQLLGS